MMAYPSIDPSGPVDHMFTQKARERCQDTELAPTGPVPSSLQVLTAGSWHRPNTADDSGRLGLDTVENQSYH